MDDFEKYFASSLHFLSRRPRSEKELRDNLIKKLAKRRSASGGKAQGEIIDRIVAVLKEKRYLDDKAFTLWWIENRSTFQPRAKRFLRLELLKKGVAKDLIDQVFSQEDRSTSDLSEAKKLVVRKIGRIKHLPKAELYQKIGGFLARRGFGWDTIKRSIDEVLQEEYNSG